MESSGVAKIMTYDQNKDYYYMVTYVDDRFEEQIGNCDETFKLNGNEFNEAQCLAAQGIKERKNVFFAAPSSSGKTTMLLWAIMELSKIGHSFALVVKDEYRKKLMKNELNRIGCHSRVCVSSNDANITSDSGLIITIGDLHKMVSDRRITEMTDWFLIDDLDLLQDPNCGLVLEEILIRLPPTAHYVLTSTNFSHAELYPLWISTIQRALYHVVVVKRRPFGFLLNISIPKDLNNMKSCCISTAIQPGGFSIDEAAFNEAMNEFYVPKKPSDVVSFVEKHTSSFPVFQTVRAINRPNDFSPRSVINRPVIVVTFDDDHAKLYGKRIGQTMCLIDGQKQYAIKSVREEFNVNPENDSFLLLNQLYIIATNGVAYLNGQMSDIARDFVETLFHRKLLQVLVITEDLLRNSTFRQGTLVIASCRKFDGKTYRYLTNYEWERLLSFLRGTVRNRGQELSVTLVLDWKLSLDQLRTIVIPEPVTPRSSLIDHPNRQNMPSNILLRSFYRYLKQIESSYAQNENEYIIRSVQSTTKKNLDAYGKLRTERDNLSKELDEKTFVEENIMPYLNVGRLIKVVDGEKNFGLGIVVRYTMLSRELYVAIRVSRDSHKNIHDFGLLTPAHPDEIKCFPGQGPPLPIVLVEIVKVPIRCVKLVYDVRISLPKSLREPKNFNFLQILLTGIEDYTANKVRIEHPELNGMRTKLESLNRELEANPLTKNDNFAEEWAKYNDLQEFIKKFEANERLIEEANNIPFSSIAPL